MANEYISTLSGAQMDTALMDMAQHTSEAWATGTRNGQDVDTTDETYQNNAKYYAEQAGRVVPEGQAAVRYDLAQALTDTEKAQARANIDAPNPTELLDLKMLGYTVPKDFAIQNYKENGVFHQQVGRVDLGTLNWTHRTSSATSFISLIPNIKTQTTNLKCSLYSVATGFDTGMPNMSMGFNPSLNYLFIQNLNYTDPIAFKTAMSGVYLYYELDSEITRPIDGGEWVARYSNPNLLDNWWFGKGVINQRGFTSGSTNGYCIDRWKIEGSTGVTVTSNGITLASVVAGSLIQYFEQSFMDNLAGKTVTFSVLQDGVVYSHTDTFPTLGNSIGTDDLTPTLGFWLQNIDGYKRLRLRTKGVGETHLVAVKFELGSVSTLANDSAPDYATELLKCQRYYYRINGVANSMFAVGHMYATETFLGHIQFPVTMRTPPTTMTYSSASGFRVVTDRSYTSSSLIMTNPNAQGTFLQVVVSGAIEGKGADVRFITASDWIAFSAEL